VFAGTESAKAFKKIFCAFVLRRVVKQSVGASAGQSVSSEKLATLCELTNRQ